MTKTPEKTESRWAELSDEVLESVEASRKEAIDAIRKFVDQVSGDLPDESRRKNVINVALGGIGHRADRVRPQRGASAGQAVGK